MNLKKILAVGLLTTAAVSVALAQQEPPPAPVATPPPKEPTVEDYVRLRNEVLDLFGIPRDTQVTYFDLLAGSTTAPYLNIKKKPNFGPLQDAQLLIDTKTLRPGTRVRAFVVTFTADPQKSTFVWYHNGARVASGKGKTFYEFTLGQLGSTETIRVVVDSNAGTSRELTKTIRPARIHFSWFTDSYTPPWYRGKALPSPGSTIIVSAFPDLRIGTTRLDPKSLIYEWSVNDTPRPRDSGESGYGKNVFTLRTQVIGARSFTIGVTVKDERERVVHTESTQIAIQSPNMLFYERDALLGTRFERIADRALAKSGGDFLIEFEPYFLPRGIFDTLRINWAVNGERLGNVTRDNRTLRLTTEDGGFGQQVVSATYENAENIFQRGSAQTIITVGQP